MRAAGICGEQGSVGRSALNVLLGALMLGAFVSASPVAAQSASPDSTTQIPPSNLAPIANPAPADAGQSPDIYDGDPIVTYERHQNSLNDIPPNVGSLEDFMAGNGGHSALLGLDVTEDSRRLKSGQSVDGLLITKVADGSPAAQAGLKAYHHVFKHSLEAAAVAGAFIVPVAAPLIFAVPALEASHFGESYDLVIGIDGVRVTTMLEMQDCLRDATPGETVYLSLIRNGERIQVPVALPDTMRASR